MWTLGIHTTLEFEFETAGESWDGHDTAAVLLRDSELVSAIEEERLNRVKHSNRVPRRAIRRSLEAAGIGLREVDLIAVPLTEADAEIFNKARALLDPRLPRYTSGAAMISSLFDREFGEDVAKKIRFCQHHRAHLWSAAVPSGFDECLVVSLDGYGPDGAAGVESGMIATYDGDGLEVLRTLSGEQSLGNFYNSVIACVGYSRFDEYKVMGLAPYGDPAAFAPLFSQLYSLKPEGEYELAPLMKRMWAFQRSGLLDGVRRKGEPFTQRHKDIAAGLQTALETIALHVLTHFREATGRRRLGLAGGVAHNCTMNGRIIGSGLFDDVFVQPAAHDAGLAIGAAIAAAKAEGVQFPRAQMPHVYLGTDIRTDGVESRLRRWGALVDVRRSAAVEREAAKLIADGKVLGWVQGRSEFGPRALGNRSILADPRPRENKTIINSMVKKREAYRPFAPSVLVERMRDYFRVPDGVAALPFMIVVVDVLEDKRELLGAVTHVDGTARVQTVSRGANERYWELIAQFGELTGVPVLLNTSFNNNAEPIVDSVDDAVVCFLTTRIDCLVVDDCIVTRKPAGLTPETLRGFAANVPASHKLVKQKWASDGGAPALRDRFGIQSHASAHFGEVFGEISPTMFAVLSHEPARPLGAIWDQLALGQGERARFVEEVLDLWQRRLITLQPSGPGSST